MDDRLKSAPEDRWCPTCGTLVPPGASACPHCGMPMERLGIEPRIPKIEDDDIADQPTRFLPKLMSAIPSEEDRSEEERVRPRATLALVVAALGAVALIGGFLLYLWHPWDPDFFDTRAQTPADTSMEGFPGTVDRLQGQDSDGATVSESLTSDEATHRALTEALEGYDAIADELDLEFQTLESDFDAPYETREADAQAARSTSIELSNLISGVQQEDMSSGTYLSAQSELVRMGNYLRNRADALTRAWDSSLSSDDPSADKLRALDEAEREGAEYARLFQEARGSFALPEPVS